MIGSGSRGPKKSTSMICIGRLDTKGRKGVCSTLGAALLHVSQL